MTAGPGQVRTSVDRSVAFVELDRPPLNVLDLKMLGELDAAIAHASADDGLCALVIRGAGTRAFSAGVDLEDHRPAAARSMLHAVHRAVLGLVRAPLVTIAAVRGFCLGGGLELATSCDLVIADDGATLGQPEVKVGCFPPVACARLAALVGPARAADMILTGRAGHRGARARDRARVPRGTARPRDRGGAGIDPGAFAARAPGHGRGDASAAVAALEARLAENETIYERRLIGSHDMTEGIEAFLQKRAPQWKHE